MVEIIKFDKSMLNTRETYQEYGRRQKKLREEAKTYKSKGPYDLGPGYSAWMYGRRMSDYSYYFQLQSGLIHRITIGGTYNVCSCGLTIDGKCDDKDMLNIFGHVDVATKEVVSIFVFDSKVICQGCGELGEVDPNGEVALCAAAVKKAREEHVCEFAIPDEVRELVAKLIAKAK